VEFVLLVTVNKMTSLIGTHMCFLTQKDHAIDQYNTQMIIIPGQTLVFPED